MINLLLLNILILIIVKSNATYYENCSYIIHVDSDVMRKEIRANKYVIVLFFNDRCRVCASTEKSFKIAAEVLLSNYDNIKLFAVNTKVDHKLYYEFNLNYAPTIKLFINSKMFEFELYSTALPFIYWVLSSITARPPVIKTSRALKELSVTEKYIIIGFFKNPSSTESKIFQETVKQQNSLGWAIVTDADIFRDYNIVNDSYLVVFRNFDEPRVNFKENITPNAIQKFIKETSTPYLTLFYDRKELNRISFDLSIEWYLIGFTDSKSKKFTLHKMLLTKAAKQFLGKVKFIYTDVDDHVATFLYPFFHYTKEDTPTYGLLRLLDDYKTESYRPTNLKMSSKRIVEYIRKVLNGSITQLIRREKLHQRWNKYPVKVLVTDNYEEVTQDPNRTVFVQLCATKCTECEKSRFLLHELAMSFKDKPHVWVANIDMDKNDLVKYRIRTFPEYRLYPRNSDKDILYMGERTITEFQQFIDSEGEIHNILNYTRVDPREGRQKSNFVTDYEYEEPMSPEDHKLIMSLVE